MPRIALLVLNLLFASGAFAPAFAQAFAESDTLATHRPVAPPTSHVVVDAPSGMVWIGAAAHPTMPGTLQQVAPGVALRIELTDAPGTWNPRRSETTVTVALGDTLQLSMALPDRIRVESIPLGANLALETDGTTRELGSGPLTVDLPAGTTGTLVATLDGYQAAHQALSAVADGHTLLILRPDGVAAEAPIPVTILPTQRSGARRRLIDWGLGAVTVASAAVAVHYKFRADDLDSDYRDPLSPQRGEETIRKEAQRLDRFSGLALGVMQLGLGALAVRFVLR